MTRPKSRPRWDAAKVRATLEAYSEWPAETALLGVRGYFRDTMGRPGVNDRGIYDDALFLVGPDIFLAFNANVDPSPWGINPRIGRGYAMLTPGAWLYKIGWHKRGRPGGHEALVQAAPVTVDRRLRAEDPPILDTGWFGINIHRGGAQRPGSEGCQTLPPDQWPALLPAVRVALGRSTEQRLIPYTLLEAQG